MNSLLRRLSFCCAALALLASSPGRLCAATFDVASGNVLELKSAILTANTNNEADTINLAVGGVYILTNIDNSFGGDNGLPLVADDVSGAGSDLTIKGNGATIQRSGTSTLFRILQISSNATCAIQNLALAGGSISKRDSGAGGGAIFNNGGSLLLNNCIFSNNACVGQNGTSRDFADGLPGFPAEGGALYSTGPEMTATNCTFNGNSATGGIGGGSTFARGGVGGFAAGGAMFCSNVTMVLSNCRFTSNSATAGNGGGGMFFGDSGSSEGGALWTTSGVLIGCSFDGNRALLNGSGSSAFASGGAISSVGLLHISQTTLHNNWATSGGGALASGGSVRMSDSTCSSNQAERGGALYDSSESGNGLLLTNCTLASNSATVAGAILLFNGTLANCTLSENNATSAGGIFTGGTVSLANTLLKAGTNGVNLVAAAGARFISQGHNLSSDPAGGDASTGPNGFLGGTNDKRNTDPKLSSSGLAGNGGVTKTIALSTNSPAIDGGNDANAPVFDQRGYPRIGTSDIGAFEFNSANLRFTDLTLDGSDVTLGFVEAVQGQNYRLERKFHLNEPQWQSISNVADLTPAVTGAGKFVHPGGKNQTQTFYRVRLLP